MSSRITIYNMKYLSLLILPLLTACGAGPGSSGEKSGATEHIEFGAVVLSASRDDLNTYRDAVYSTQDTINIVLPASMGATAGGGEIGRVTLSLGVTDCYYVSNAVPGRYDLDVCVGGQVAGDTVSVPPGNISMHIESGYASNRVMVDVSLVSETFLYY